MKAKIFVLLLFLIAAPSFGQLKKYSPAEIKSDTQFMISTMEETHINLYAKFPKQDFYNELKNIGNSIKDSLTIVEFWKMTAPLIAKLGDGHTSFRLPREGYMQFLKDGGKLFPFDVKVEEDKLFTEGINAKDSSILSGSEIISINGVDASKIIDSMMVFVSGEKPSFRNTSVAFSFKALLCLLFDMTGNYTIKYKAVDDPVIKEAAVEGLNKDDVMRNAMKQTVFENPYKLKLLEDETVALIDFRSFSNYEIFKKFLDTTFSVIEGNGIKNLIIDIRKNGGGNSSLGDLLFDYITDTPYCQFMRADVKTNGEVKTYNNELTKPNNPINKFHGKVYLLTSSATFSSANSFSSAFKCYKMGTIVGEETGGVTVAYGDIKTFTLPNTQLQFGVSFKKFWEACGKEDGHGVLPDYEVKQDPEDSAKGIDTALEFTLNLIKKS